jgi:hypothetical protein
MGSFASYDRFFETAASRKPFPYQQRLAEATRFPNLLRIERGCGKTAAAKIQPDALCTTSRRGCR